MVKRCPWTFCCNRTYDKRYEIMLYDETIVTMSLIYKNPVVNFGVFENVHPLIPSLLQYLYPLFSACM